MATRSAAKAHRQSIKRRLRNRMVKTFTRNKLRRAQAVILSAQVPLAEVSLREAISALDRAARKGVYHPNKAARQKARLMARFNAAKSATSED
ncbi:MAG TPA: 30S ribosomal protein S20 [Dehalococcoidia bacterium]|nr:30S ribosomal protein S20 [Dehalococcoidia bacterium]